VAIVHGRDSSIEKKRPAEKRPRGSWRAMSPNGLYVGYQPTRLQGGVVGGPSERGHRRHRGLWRRELLESVRGRKMRINICFERRDMCDFKGGGGGSFPVCKKSRPRDYGGKLVLDGSCSRPKGEKGPGTGREAKMLSGAKKRRETDFWIEQGLRKKRGGVPASCEVKARLKRQRER